MDLPYSENSSEVLDIYNQLSRPECLSEDYDARKLIADALNLCQKQRLDKRKGCTASIKHLCDCFFSEDDKRIESKSHIQCVVYILEIYNVQEIYVDKSYLEEVAKVLLSYVSEKEHSDFLDRMHASKMLKHKYYYQWLCSSPTYLKNAISKFKSLNTAKHEVLDNVPSFDPMTYVSDQAMLETWLTYYNTAYNGQSRHHSKWETTYKPALCYFLGVLVGIFLSVFSLGVFPYYLHQDPAVNDRYWRFFYTPSPQMEKDFLLNRLKEPMNELIEALKQPPRVLSLSSNSL